MLISCKNVCLAEFRDEQQSPTLTVGFLQTVLTSVFLVGLAQWQIWGKFKVLITWRKKEKKKKNKNPYGIAQLSRGWWWCCCCCRCCKLTSVLSAVPVADIKAVITGKDCPHMKEKGALKQNKVCVCVWVCAHTCTCTCACVWAGGCVSRRENEFLCMRELHNEDVGYIISL